MKGFIIFEDFKKLVNCKEILDGDYNCVISDYPNGTFGGIINRVTGATCNKDDTYDFEVGALIALMKMCGRDKVIKACDELYKEAYGSRVIWCSSQPSTRDMLDSLLDSCKYAIPTDKHGEQINKLTADSLIEQSRAFTRKCIDEWLCKPPTKREEMWEKILNASKNPPVDIKVAKQDIKTFLKELQDKIPEAMWNGSDDYLPIEYTNPYWFKHDYFFFALFRYDDKGKLRICYDDHKHSWIDKPVIEYIAPMRWDLFKKGRLAVKVNYFIDNYKEFYEACEKELGKKPSTYPILWDGVTISISKKDGNFEIFTMEDQKKTGRKIVNWEDVR